MSKTGLNTIAREDQFRRRERLPRYIGMVAMLQNQENIAGLREYIVTELAESLDSYFTNELHPYCISIENDRVYGAMGEDLITSTTTWAITTLDRVHSGEPELRFLAEMANAEAEEMHQLVEFYQTTKVGDILLKVSNMPNAPIDLLRQEGFHPELNRAFVRIYTRTLTGLRAVTKSFDNATLTDWNTILNINVQSSTDLLLRTFTNDNQPLDERGDWLRQRFDALKKQQTGQEHYGGRRLQSDSKQMDAMAFVDRHSAIINQVKEELISIPHNTPVQRYDTLINNIFYKAKASLQRKYLLFQSGEQDLDYQINQVATMMSYDGAEASASGITFSGCSGSSTMISENAVDTAAENFSSSFSKPNLPSNQLDIIMKKTECPYCCQKVIAPFDKVKKVWLGCGNSKCTAYSSDAIPLMTAENSMTTAREHPAQTALVKKSEKSTQAGLYKSALFQLRTIQDETWRLQYALFNTPIEDKRSVIRYNLQLAHKAVQYILWAMAHQVGEDEVLTTTDKLANLAYR